MKIPAWPPLAKAPFSQAWECVTEGSSRRAAKVDQMMSWLLGAEWVGMVVTALVLSPRTWNGANSYIHPHLWAALLSGPTFIFSTILLGCLYPGKPLTRHVISVAQMLVSVLLIDITGGRIETHFHIFGSLAFLALYRDWRVLATASGVIAVDHLIGGIWWPQAVYGTLTASPWRWMEHVWWVAFEDFFLIVGGMREARLEWGAHHDVLTGLPNRRFLNDHFEAVQHHGVRCAVIYLDLDRFKQANDTLGHLIGDKLLKTVAQRLSTATDELGMLARVGGDEFVALIEERAQDQVCRIASQFLDALQQPFYVDGHELILSASAGIAIYPEHGTGLAELQECADQAMYSAKRQGRNRCAVFSPEMARADSRLEELSRDLHHALPSQELTLHYQPLIGLDGEAVGFEALLRWLHPALGLVAPIEFIPIAEASGLIVSMGEWVLRQACRTCRSWPVRNGRPLSVAVNVSAVQFESSDFVDKVRSILHETNLPPDLLTLELTEGVLVGDFPHVRKQLDAIRAMGVHVALDDFGTGYSSLSYFTSLPADIVKLDRSFLDREGTLRNPAVVELIVSLAHRLGLHVVAEGVETSVQAERLVDLNCDRLQGFHFSRPIPAEEIPAWLASQGKETRWDTTKQSLEQALEPIAR